MKIFALLFMLLALPVMADTPTPDFGFLFNNLPGQPLARKYQLGTKLREAHNQIECIYDYATSGGAVSTLILKSTDLVTPCGIPGKSVIMNVVINSTTTMTSGGNATVALETHGGSANLLAATGKASFTSSAILQGVPDWATVADMVKVGAGTVTAPLISIDAVIATAALTAGRFRVIIQYALGD